MNLTNYSYNSISHFLNVVDALPTKKGYFDSSDKTNERNDSVNFAEAKNWILNGRELQNFNLEKIESAINSVKNEFDFTEINSVAGAYVNIGNFVTGNPENMINYQFEEIQKSNKFLTFKVNCSLSYTVTNKDILKASNEILKAIYLLELQGYQTEIFCFVKCRDKGKKLDTYYNFEVKTKNFGEKLNLQTFFSCISTDFIRRFYFKFCETVLKGESVKFAKGYGVPIQNEGNVILNDIIDKSINYKDIAEAIVKSN